MTPFDRVEPRISELMSELAPASVPDYFDDMLWQTARTRQRPAWRSLERMLPMGVIARTAPVRQAPWRPILLLALVGLLAAAAVVVLSGAGKPRLLSPFGPARNGVIVMSISGDIVTVDPVTRTKTVIIGGPETDTQPVFSGLGTQILFTRNAYGSPPAVFMADADGSNVRHLISGSPDSQHLWWDWTADGRRLIYPSYEQAGTRTLILDTVTGTTTEPHPGVDQHFAMWRPGHDEYVFRSFESGRVGYFLASADGSAVRAIQFPIRALDTALSVDGLHPAMSPDGSKLVYVQGEGDTGPPPTLATDAASLHTLDIDTGQDRQLTPPGDGYAWSNPQFSPDGTRILAERSPATAPDVVQGTSSLVLVPVDGGGPVVELGLPYDAVTPPAHGQFSPDGTSVLADYNGTLWLLDTTGGPGQQFDWTFALAQVSPERQGGGPWQRLAP